MLKHQLLDPIKIKIQPNWLTYWSSINRTEVKKSLGVKQNAGKERQSQGGNDEGSPLNEWEKENEGKLTKILSSSW